MPLTSDITDITDITDIAQISSKYSYITRISGQPSGKKGHRQPRKQHEAVIQVIFDLHDSI
ncbi:MAG: hypothetical protein SPD11_10155 [Sphaerochaetaceae bacterium]|nr:hypothetical protein [Sphaerochaetaceae bacterium]